MKKFGKAILKFTLSLAAIALGYVAINLYSFYTEPEVTTDNQDSHIESFKKDYKIYSLASPKSLSFCNENVPLDILDVKERLDRELLVNTYWQSNTLLYLKRSARYFPIIKPILKKNGVPEDFKYLALIESGLENVVSPAGATGFWQIMKTTGKEFGLEINSKVDERYHLEKATEFACEYLKQAKAKFGTWTMAAASYNMGMNGLSTQLQRQKTNNYYDLLLIAETSRYLFRILAVKQIMENAESYGFNVRESDYYTNIETVNIEVNQPIEDLALFAYDNGVNYKILKQLNPWLRDTSLPNYSAKKYAIKLPKNAETSGMKVYKKPNLESDSLINGQ